MKPTFLLPTIIATIFLFTACGNPTNSLDDTPPPRDPAATPVFATPGEAVAKAKADLLEILRQRADLNLGIDAETLAAATATSPIVQQSLDFDRLLEADTSTTFEGLVREVLPTVVPLRTDQQVVTLVQLTPTDNGWQLAELAGQGLTQDLNRVMASTQASAEAIRIIQVPNLQATIFAVSRDGYTTYHTRYNGMPIGEGLDEAYLLEILGRDARRFEERYGADVRRQQLVR